MAIRNDPDRERVLRALRIWEQSESDDRDEFLHDLLARTWGSLKAQNS
jgi:hypothetical protein